MTSRFEKAEELGELLGVVSARRHCIGFTFIENDDNSTRHRGLTLRGRTPAYGFAAATVTLFFFYLSYLASSYSRGMTLCSSFAKFSARTLRLLDLPMCVIGQMLARSFRFYVHVQPFIWKTLDLPRPTCAEVRCRLCSDDSGDKLRQSGVENELLNRFTDQVEANRGVR